MGSNRFTNQEIQTHYSVSVDHNSMAAHLTRSDVKGFEKCCILNVVGRTGGGKLWNVSSECEGEEGTDCDNGDSDSNW